MAFSLGPIVVTREVSLASPAKAVWPLLTDTDRTNRKIGSRPVAYQAIDPSPSSGARFLAQTRVAGFDLTYEEAPFEWTLHRAYGVHRKMRGGPIEGYFHRLTLAPTDDGGTRVTVHIEMTPRHWALWPIAAFQARKFVDALADVARQVDAHLLERAPHPFGEPRSPVQEGRLGEAVRELKRRAVAPAVVARLEALIREGADADLVRLRPFELASQWSLPPREVLRACLHAVRAGLFELKWSLVCPSCRTSSSDVDSLQAIPDEGHCQLCDISYGIELDRAVEATFFTHPQVRKVPSLFFCIAGPGRTPHVLVQANVAAGESRELVVPEEDGRLRLFARGGAIATLEVSPEAPERAVAVLGEGFSPRTLPVAPRGVVRVTNQTAEPRHVKIERLGYASHAATAHEVTLLPEFRRLFSHELLKPGTSLKVTRATLFFSDLTGSTALYTREGDAAAFRLVDDHFDVLRRSIEAEGGTLVKTMGDAVMAAFADGGAAVRAAISALRAFERFARERQTELGLKLGLFDGPCYLVSANGTLDYFGQTVNCAARVQHLAAAGELVLPRELVEQLPEGDRAALEQIEVLETRVKGIAEPLALTRTRLRARSGLTRDE